MLELIRADMEEFTLSEPAALITIPFRSFLHKISMEDKLRTLRHLHEQLRPGGRLIFDAFVYNPESAQRFGSPHLRAEYRDEKTHRDVLLWAATRYDEDQQAIRIVSWTDELDREGVVVRRKYRRLDFSWLDPEQARSLLLDAGFEVEAVYQDYEKTPFAPGAGLHIWVARKPGEGSNPAASGA
jgi:SAM-dependent methyltransferase